jgi:hypothetical protein
LITLQLATENAPAVGPEPSLAPFKVWCDPAGALIARGYTDGGQHWLHFPRLATYQFDDGADVVVAAPEAGAAPETIADIFLRAVLPLVLHTRGQETLHASAVVTPEGVVAFCARSETGKSTLAFGLAQRGYTPFSDDAVVLRQSGDRWLAVPYPFQFRLRTAPAAHFAADGTQCQRHPPSTSDDMPVAGEPQPLAALFLLTKLRPAEASAPVIIRQLSPAEALPLLLPHAYSFSLENPARKRQMATAYLDLVTAVPAYDLRYAGTLDALPQVLDGIEARLKQGVGDRSDAAR